MILGPEPIQCSCLFKAGFGVFFSLSSFNASTEILFALYENMFEIKYLHDVENHKMKTSPPSAREAAMSCMKLF